MGTGGKPRGVLIWTILPIGITGEAADCAWAGAKAKRSEAQGAEDKQGKDKDTQSEFHEEGPPWNGRVAAERQEIQ